ncbi:MAG: NERD domain-containing protein [Nitrospirae bacterium]|nr:NERD domain-containing protein [Nitrospirota bacterium]
MFGNRRIFMKGKYSPLKEKPLRVPGQSADEAIENLIADDQTKYVAYGSTFIVFAIYEWVRSLTADTFHPILISIVAGIAVFYSVFRLRQIRDKIRNFKMGRDGERTVAEILDELREHGYAVLHDIVGDGFNVDHVVLSSHGIFTIETKTRSKSDGSQIGFAGDNIIIGGRASGNDAIIQSEAEAKWLRDLLTATTGKRLPVKPVLVFPGWFVEPMPKAIKERVWVLNPKAVPSFIAGESVQIADADVHLATFHLSRYVRIRGQETA